MSKFKPRSILSNKKGLGNMNGLETNKHSAEGKFVYILKGNPISLQRAQHGNDPIWDVQKEKRVISSISLSSQHNDRPLYSGSLLLVIDFYFLHPQCGPRSKKKITYHGMKPSLNNCIKYIQDVCIDILYKDPHAICSIHATKKYDTYPRTEFYIVELK